MQSRAILSLTHFSKFNPNCRTFIEATQRFCFGNKSKALQEKRIATVQTLSGTGALRVGAEFLKNGYGKEVKIFVPTPTWGNHNKIFARAGLEVGSYRYWRAEKRDLDYEGRCRCGVRSIHTRLFVASHLLCWMLWK